MVVLHWVPIYATEVWRSDSHVLVYGSWDWPQLVFIGLVIGTVLWLLGREAQGRRVALGALAIVCVVVRFFRAVGGFCLFRASGIGLGGLEVRHEVAVQARSSGGRFVLLDSRGFSRLAFAQAKHGECRWLGVGYGLRPGIASWLLGESIRSSTGRR